MSGVPSSAVPGTISPEVVRSFRDELCKLGGLPRPPAMVGSAVQKVISGGMKPTLTGGTSVASKLSKATSPAALVPPPPISA